jgi:hypothetical protein
MAAVYHAQILTYLKLTGSMLGLLVNFNTKDILKGIFRQTTPQPDSLIKTRQISSFDQRRFIKWIGVCKAPILQNVLSNISLSLGL